MRAMYLAYWIFMLAIFALYFAMGFADR